MLLFVPIVLFVSLIRSSRCAELYVFPESQAYYSEMSLNKIDSGRCEEMTKIGPTYTDYYVQRFSQWDVRKGIIYTIALVRNDSIPAGPFNPILLYWNVSSGEIVDRMELTKFQPMYLGLEHLTMNLNSKGNLIIIAKYDEDEEFHLMELDPKTKQIEELRTVLGSKYSPTCSAYDLDLSILYVPYRDDILGFSMKEGEKGKQILSFKNEANLDNMDYDSNTKLVYGIGVDYNNGYTDVTLYNFDQKQQFTKVGAIGSGYPFSITQNSVVKDGLGFYFAGPNMPHVSVYYLFAIKLEDASTISSGRAEKCCAAMN